MPYLIASGIGAVGSIASGIFGAGAESKAAKAEEQAFREATNLEEQNYATAQQAYAPYQAAGTNALAQIQKLLNIGPGTAGNATDPILQMLGIGGGGAGINPATFQASPGYQYALQQGTQAVNNAAATGGGVGGNALKQLQATGQGLANQNFTNYLNSASGAFQGLLGNLGGLVSTGQNATNSISSLGANVAKQAGANAIGAGEAQGSGIVGSSNALWGGITNALNNIGGGLTGGPGTGGAPNGGGGVNALLYALMNQGGAPIPGQPSAYAGQMVDTSGWGAPVGPNNIPATVWNN